MVIVLDWSTLVWKDIRLENDIRIIIIYGIRMSQVI